MTGKIKYCSIILVSVLAVFSCRPKDLVVSEGTANVNGSDIFYKIVGEGEPMVVVHGGPVLDHTYFLPHLENLARDYQLIFYDQRAAGQSSTEVDSSKMTISDFAEDIELLRRHLGFDKINLMGHSWGGLLATIYAIRHSDRLNHLILSNSMAPNVHDWQKESEEVAKLQTSEDREIRQAYIDSIRNYPDQRYRLIGEFLKTSFKPQMYDRSNLDKLELTIPDDYDLRSGLTRLLGPDMSTFDYDSLLRNIQCPTLLIYGEMEPAVKMYSQKMLSLIPNSELVTIGQSGHFPFIEQPKKFRQAVKSFLAD